MMNILKLTFFQKFLEFFQIPARNLKILVGIFEDSYHSLINFFEKISIRLFSDSNKNLWEFCKNSKLKKKLKDLIKIFALYLQFFNLRKLYDFQINLVKILLKILSNSMFKNIKRIFSRALPENFEFLKIKILKILLRK